METIKEELNLDILKVVNQNSAQYKRMQDEKYRMESERLIKETLATLDEKKVEDNKKRIYLKSVQDEKVSKRQQVHGKTYVGKRTVRDLVIAASAISIAILVSKGGYIATELMEFDNALDKKMATELTEEERTAYKDDHKNWFATAFENYEEIADAKESLNPDDYDIQGNNITDTDKEYLPFDEDGLFRISEFQQDAIDIATDNVIEEYQGRGM